MSTNNSSPLTCEQVSELINEYIDGELDAATAAAVASHIAECDGCRRLYDEISAVCQAAAQAGECEIPEGLHESIMSALKAQKRRERRRKIMTYMGVGVAAMLCVGVFSSTLMQHMASNSDDMVLIWAAETDASVADGEDGRGNDATIGGTPTQSATAADTTLSPEVDGAHDNIDSYHSATGTGRIDTAGGLIVDTLSGNTTSAETTTPAYADTTVVAQTTYASTATAPVPVTTAPAEPEPAEPSEEWTNAPAEQQTDGVASAPSETLHGTHDKNSIPSTSAPQYAGSVEIYNTWTLTAADGTVRTLALRPDGSFKYNNGKHDIEGTFEIEQGVITLHYGLFSKSQYSLLIIDNRLYLDYVSGRRLFK
ncbi:MAG: zf-HC2 domain-containing protein [Clostridia bacterium]|nr:zf-HC2 domain-containing protein [Clostridia bacterium]